MMNAIDYALEDSPGHAGGTGRRGPGGAAPAAAYFDPCLLRQRRNASAMEACGRDRRMAKVNLKKHARGRGGGGQHVRQSVRRPT